MNIINTTNPTVAAEFLASKIIQKLEEGKKVLWFATGGSSIAVQSKASELIALHSHENLVIMLTDERYGPIDYPESNWNQTLAKGFKLPEAKIIPILTGENLANTTTLFNENLEKELQTVAYKIGLFGIGADGHTAGMLPGSIAVNSNQFASSYVTPNFERITITPRVIELLNEVVVFTQGENKWPILTELDQEIPIIDKPVQVLKKVPLLTIFTDYKKVKN